MPTAPANDSKPTMAQRIEAEAVADPLVHDWVAAATIRLDSKTAGRAAFRGSFRTEADMRIDALETYCSTCRRPHDQVEGKPCEGKIDNTHLIGGDPGVRAKRIHHKPVGRIIKTGPVNRRGWENGYSVHSG